MFGALQSGKTDNRIRVGYWSKAKEAEELPWPGNHVHLFWDEAEKARVAHYLMQGAHVATYRGISRCRLCGKTNGCSEFGDERYVWPSGLAHYISVHAVKPPQDFIDWVNEKGRLAGSRQGSEP
jgi:hypothetical protein